MTQEKRKYPMSDGDFAEKCDAIMVAVDRDMADLATYGVTAASAQVVLDQIADFKAFHDDDYYNAIVINATAAKNVALKNLEDNLQSLMVRVRVKLGSDSSVYQGLNWDTYYKLSQAEKKTRAQNIHDSINDQIALFPDTGITAASQLVLQGLITTLDTKLTDKDKAVSLRREKTVARIKLGNELYKSVSGLCEFGQDKWRGNNSAKYEDYIIHETQHTPVQNEGGTVPPNAVALVSVTVDQASQKIKITNNGTTVLLAYCAMDDEDPVPVKFVTIPPGESVEKPAPEYNFSDTATNLFVRNDTDTAIPYDVRVKG